MADMRDIQAPPAPLGPGTWGNIAKGSWIGLLLLAAPWASTYAFGPVDRALGLGAVNFIAELNKISPLLGTPVLIFRDYVMGSIIVWAGLVCVHSGLRSLLKDRPQGDVLALAGLAGLAAVFLVFPHFLGTVLHACGEEAVFRKYLIGVLKEKSAGGALLKSSLIFSAAHILMHGLSFDLLALKTIIGLTLGLAYLKTGSLAAPSAMHGVYNLCILSDGANPGEFLLGLLPCGIADLAAWLATGLALLAARRWLSAPRDVLR
jgi:membrane protease YdiL (CAAX protease family)